MTSAERSRHILGNYERIEFVGFSTDPSRASSRVARCLLDSGFEVIPVNP